MGRATRTASSLSILAFRTPPPPRVTRMRPPTWVFRSCWTEPSAQFSDRLGSRRRLPCLSCSEASSPCNFSAFFLCAQVALFSLLVWRIGAFIVDRRRRDRCAHRHERFG